MSSMLPANPKPLTYRYVNVFTTNLNTPGILIYRYINDHLTYAMKIALGKVRIYEQGVLRHSLTSCQCAILGLF